MLVSKILTEDNQGLSANSLAICFIIFTVLCLIFSFFSFFNVYSNWIKNRNLIFSKTKNSLYYLTFATIMMIFNILAIVLVCQNQELKNYQYLIIILPISLVLLFSSGVFNQVVNTKLAKADNESINEYKNINWSARFNDAGGLKAKTQIINQLNKTKFGQKIIKDFESKISECKKNGDKQIQVENLIIFNETNLSNWNYLKNKLNLLLTLESLIKYGKQK